MTPAGTSDVASTSPSVTAGSGRDLRGEDDGGVAADDGRREARHEPEQRRRLRRDEPDDAGRLGDREVEVRRRDRVDRAQDLADLVGPAGVPDPAVDRVIDTAAGLGRRSGPRPRRPRRRTARGGPPSARRRGRGPGRGSSPSGRPSPRLRRAPSGPRRAGPCARRGGVGERRAVRARDDVGAAGLRARELAADVELVRLADRDARRRLDLRPPSGRRATYWLPYCLVSGRSSMRLCTRGRRSAAGRCSTPAGTTNTVAPARAQPVRRPTNLDAEHAARNTGRARPRRDGARETRASMRRQANDRVIGGDEVAWP